MERADALVHAVVRDWRQAPLSDADLALCRFGAKVTHEHHGSTEDDIEALRGYGFDDGAIHNATQVVLSSTGHRNIRVQCICWRTKPQCFSRSLI